jgi:creatinine amidohydrolase
MNEILFHHKTREEITDMARKGYAIVVPLAATEQHGPHLPVYTDSFICDYVVPQAVLKASQSVSILMVPTLTIGCSDHHLAFGGTISFSSSTYSRMLNDIGESLVTCGFRKIIFLNAHGGNEALMIQAANDLMVRHPIWTAGASLWSIANSHLQEIGAGEVGNVPGHAGGFETAAILAIRPDLVREEHIKTTHTIREWIGSGPKGTFIGRHKELTGYDGYSDAANKATAEKGTQYLNTFVDSVSGWLVHVCNSINKGEQDK